jgi:alkaline phosphatase
VRRRWRAAWLLAWAGLAPAAEPAAPRNVILMIGDGMGFGQINLARLSPGGGALRVDTMPVVGLVRVSPLDDAVPDSAAAATALAGGRRTRNGRIAELPDGTPVRTVLEASEQVGRSTGLVTTTTITHATPAAFGAHVRSRAMESEIAAQLIEVGADVLLGGGLRYFLPRGASGSGRADPRDLRAEARADGFALVESRQALREASGPRVLGLFALQGMTTRPPEPSLAEMTARAIELLAQDPDGFFLMSEGGQIDWACHDNDAARTLDQMRGFDEAVEAALGFARRRGDTLVLVTADHETGGLTLIQDGHGFSVRWSTDGHTASDVPLFAEGPGAGRFAGVMEAAAVARRLAGIWDLPGLPRE